MLGNRGISVLQTSLVVLGMTFNINVGFADLQDDKKKYALFLGDTVLVNEVTYHTDCGHVNKDSQMSKFGYTCTCISAIIWSRKLHCNLFITLLV